MKKILFATVLLSMALTSLGQSKAYDFSIKDIFGENHQMTDYLEQGKSVFIIFFTTGCGPCRVQVPMVDTVFRDYGCNSGEIAFFGINYGSNDEGIYNFSQNYPLSFIAASGTEGNGNNVYNDFNVPYTPYKFLFNSKGELLMEEFAMQTSSVLSDTLSVLGYQTKLCEGNKFSRFGLWFEYSDILGTIDKENKLITIDLPFKIDVTEIPASFVASPESHVFVNGVEQINKETLNDFSQGDVVFNIISETGVQENWTVRVNAPSGFEIVNQIAEIGISPNPVNNLSNLYVETKSAMASEISISDVSGRQLSQFHKKLSSGKNIISANELKAENLPEGIYFIKIAADHDYFLKFIVQ